MATPHAGRDRAAAPGPGEHPSAGIRRQTRTSPLHRPGDQGRHVDRRDAPGRPGSPRRRSTRGRPPASRPVSPTTSWTGSVTSSCSTTAPTRRRWATAGFPKSLCTSVNEVICHGIPDSTVLRDGDIVNVDITAYLSTGVHGDTDATFCVGEVDEQSRQLVERTQQAMTRGASRRSPRPPDQRHRPGDRGVRQALRLRRGPRLHRPRDRDGVPLRPGRSRTTTRRRTRHRDRARDDLHRRADAHPRHLRTGTCGTTAGRWSPRTGGAPPSSSTPSWSPRPAPRSSPCPDHPTAQCSISAP